MNDVAIADPDQLTAGGVIQGVSDLLHPVLNRCEKTLINRTFVSIFLKYKGNFGEVFYTSSMVRAFAHGAMGRPIDPSWWTH